MIRALSLLLCIASFRAEWLFFHSADEDLSPVAPDLMEKPRK